MRRVSVPLVALALIGCGGDVAGDADTLATLDLIDVAADVRAEEAAFVAASGGESLDEGDAVRTDATGYAAIDYADGSVTRLDRNSHMEVVRVGATAGPDVTLRLEVGRAWHRLRDVPDGAAFEIETAVGTAAVRGTTFVTACPSDDQCSVVALEGEVAVTASDGVTTVLGPGQGLDLGPDGATTGPQDLGDPSAIVAGDPWYQRNDRRDRGAGDDAPAVAGDWATTYGEMTFEDGSDPLTATYTGHEGELEGTLTGRVYTGTWAEPASAQACDTTVRGTQHWGRFEFLFSQDGTSFEGQWSYCDEPLDGSWTGTRPAG